MPTGVMWAQGTWKPLGDEGTWTTGYYCGMRALGPCDHSDSESVRSGHLDNCVAGTSGHLAHGQLGIFFILFSSIVYYTFLSCGTLLSHVQNCNFPKIPYLKDTF